MDSITKPVLSNDQLATICKTHLEDRLDAAVELTDGWFNAAHLLRSKNGKEAVLKTAPPDSVRLMRYEQDLMRAEVSALRLVKHLTTIPVPAVFAYDKSREIVDCDFFLSERLPGVPLDRARPDMCAEAQAKADRLVGAHLKELHNIRGPQFGTYNLPEFATWNEAFACMMEWLAKDSIDLHVDLPHRALQAGDHLLDALSEVEKPTLVHWDLWDGNIFVNPQTGDVTGLIDFERVLWGDPVIEANFQDPKPALLESYGSSHIELPGAKARRLLYDLYLHLIIVIECRFRHFTPEHEKWARSKLDATLKQLRG